VTPLTPEPGGSSAPIVDIAPATLQPIVADAANRAGVTPDQVVVVSAESVTFPDGGLGCPEPGMAYTQMLVDGYKIVLEANGITYDYRGSGTNFRLCTQSVS
jgi:hypothetical protein